MKVKRLLALILIFTLLGAATVFADTIYSNFSAKKVSVKVNGMLVDGLEVKGETKTMVPLEDIVASIGGIISVDAKGINVYKPNVQMSVVSPGDNKSLRIIQKGKGEVRLPFKVFAFMDNILTDIADFKITVVDPFGEVIESSIEPLGKEDRGKEVLNFYSLSQVAKIKYSGNYTVNLAMREVGSEEFYAVGQYMIYFEAK